MREEARAYRQILKETQPSLEHEDHPLPDGDGGPSVCFATLSAGMITSELFTSFVALMAHDIQTHRHLQEFVCKKNGGLLSIYRNQVVTEFLNDTTCDWLWMVDSDINLERNTLDLLVAAAQEHPEAQIVSGWYVVPMAQPEAAVYLWNDSERDYHTVEVPPDVPPSYVDSVGLGNVMIHRDLLLKMYRLYGLPSPWFHLKELSATDTRPAHIFGEDHSFFYRTRSDFDQRPLLVPEAHVGHVKSSLLTKEHLNVV